MHIIHNETFKQRNWQHKCDTYTAPGAGRRRQPLRSGVRNMYTLSTYNTMKRNSKYIHTHTHNTYVDAQLML